MRSFNVAEVPELVGAHSGVSVLILPPASHSRVVGRAREVRAERQRRDGTERLDRDGVGVVVFGEGRVGNVAVRTDRVTEPRLEVRAPAIHARGAVEPARGKSAGSDPHSRVPAHPRDLLRRRDVVLRNLVAEPPLVAAPPAVHVAASL